MGSGSARTAAHVALCAISLLVLVSVVSALSSQQTGHKEHKEHKEHKDSTKSQEHDGNGGSHSEGHHKSKESSGEGFQHDEKSTEESDNKEEGGGDSNSNESHKQKQDHEASAADESHKEGSESSDGKKKGEGKHSSEVDEKDDSEDDGGDGKDGEGKGDQDSDSDSSTDSGNVGTASTCGKMYLESEEKDSDHSRCEKGWAAGEDRVNGPDASRNTWWKLGFASGLEAAQRSSVGSKDSCKNLSNMVAITASRKKYDLPSEEVLDKAGFNEFKEGIGKGFADGCERAGEKGKGDLSYGYGYAHGYMAAVENSMTPNRRKNPCAYAFARGDSDHGVCDRAFNGGSLLQTQHENSSGKAARKWYRRGFLKGFRNSLWNKPSAACVLEAKQATSRVNRHLYDLPGDLHLFTDNDFKVFKEGLRRGMELECRWEQEGSTEKATYAYRFGFYRGYLKALNG